MIDKKINVRYDLQRKEGKIQYENWFMNYTITL